MMENHTLKKIIFLLIEPHPSIVGIRKREQTRFLSTILLVAIPIILLTAITSDHLVTIGSVYLGLVILVIIFYLGTRTKHHNVSLFLTIAGFTILPIMIWFFGTSWTAYDLPRLMPWVFVALIIGGLLARPHIVVMQGVFIVFIMVIVIAGIFAIPFHAYDSHIGTVGIITFFVYLTSYMLDSYFEQLNTRTQELDSQHKELEIYMQFLRHDLSNDMQGLLYSIELAEMLLDVSVEKAQETLTQTLSLAERMAQLLNIFSMPLEIPETDLVHHLEKIAEVSQESHANLSIEINTSNEVLKQKFTASRLLSLVWTNIFRNASQHGGSKITESNFISVVVTNSYASPYQSANILGFESTRNSSTANFVFPAKRLRTEPLHQPSTHFLSFFCSKVNFLGD